MAAGQRARRRLRRAGLVGAVTAAALTLAGCGQKPEPVGGLSPYPLTVQGAGDAPTMLARPPARIVALSAGLAGILHALHRAEETTLPLRTGDLSGRQLVAAVRRARPELIVAPSSFSPADLQSAVDASGAQLYVFPDTSLRDVERGLTQLGLLVDAPVAARALVGRLEDERARLAARLEGKRRTRVFVDAGFGTTIGSETLLGQLLAEAGGVDVAGANPPVAALTPAEVKRLDPDVYVVTADNATTLRALRASRWRILRAVRGGRFAVLPADALEAGPRLAGVLADLARVLHPALFR